MLMITQDHRTAVERCVPAYMMLLMMDRCEAEGLTGRADVRHHLNVASVAPLSQLDGPTAGLLAKEVDRVSQLLIRDLHADSAIEALYVCATFCLLLVDEGRLPDRNNQAVLCGLLFLEDAKDEEPDVNGERPIWSIRSKVLEDKAGRLIIRANLLGYYMRPA